MIVQVQGITLGPDLLIEVIGTVAAGGMAAEIGGKDGGAGGGSNGSLTAEPSLR